MTIKEQIERELNERVKDALDTPPLERIRRHQQETILRKSEEDYIKNLNSNIKFDKRNRLKMYNNSYTHCVYNDKNENITTNQEQDSNSEFSILDKNNKFEYWLQPYFKPQYITSNNLSKFKFDEKVQVESKECELDYESEKDLGNLTKKEKKSYFSTFTKEGFRKAVQICQLPDGSKLQIMENGCYRDKYGIERDMDGPFWPEGIGPLHAVPHHERLHIDEEPMSFLIKENNSSDCQIGDKYTGIWRNTQIVYDSEISPRNQYPMHYKENLCPSLIFESRFESGNLRQVRRIGQFEYELVLNNDLYTKKHTQWFYFQIRNMKKNVTYKLIIINLLKTTSLYMQGMRMLMYSERSAKEKNIGWHRTAHNIRYTRNLTHLQCPLLIKEMAYFQLEFHLNFLYKNDSCFLAHCYPYTYTDLKNDLRNYINYQSDKSVIQKDILCETEIGNKCFCITVTDKAVPDNEKFGVVITSRVHPGETNSSWMMNGLIKFLISNCEVANNLRKRILFKIVPMLNPDGVIVGNYRCSMSGMDLNRNYKSPKIECFPTIYHTKKLVENLREMCDEIILYCDLHGHSRKHNVFMYGCDSQYLNAEDVNDVNPILNSNVIEEFINDRIFPFLMQRNGPDIFSFSECQFKIKKCKESTGRVVMWKQFNIDNSFTLETTFSGTVLNSRRHLNISDLENIGKIFSHSLLTYISIKGDERMKKDIRMEMLKAVFKHLASKNKEVYNVFRKLKLQIDKNYDKNVNEKKSLQNIFGFDQTLDSGIKSENSDLKIDLFINNLEINDIIQLNHMSFQMSELEENSSSSDSDSESQSEEIFERTQNQIKKERLNIQIDELKDDCTQKLLLERNNEKPISIFTAFRKSLTIPDIKFSETTKNEIVNPTKISISHQLPVYLSKYKGRSNGGIPCFTEERIKKRAQRKSLIKMKDDLQESIFKDRFNEIAENQHGSLRSEVKLIHLPTFSENIFEKPQNLNPQANFKLQHKLSQESFGNEVAGNNRKQLMRKPILNNYQITEILRNRVQKVVISDMSNGAVLQSITRFRNSTMKLNFKANQINLKK